MRKVLLGVLLLTGVVVGEEVPQGNPTIKVGSFSGQSSFVPWSGDWWNMKDGELGIGWNGKNCYTYNATSKQYDWSGASVAVNDLSPMAKYDKAFGHQPMSGAAKQELTDDGYFMHHVYGKTKEQFEKDDVDYSWWGHCNGWAAAACLEAEPYVSLDKNGVRFEVADLKGLLTESHFGTTASFSGSRFNAPKPAVKESYNQAKVLLQKLKANTPAPVAEYKTWYQKAYNTTLSQSYTPAWYKGALESFIKNYDNKYTKAFEDIRPDVFHKILVKVIGEQKSSLVFDITANEAVWNYPAFAYTTKLVDKGTKKIDGYNRRVFAVATTVTYSDDGVSQSILGTRTFTKNYTYELYTTTSTKKLRGGKWTGASVEDHPDFAWFPKYNTTTADWSENVKLIWGKVIEILPAKHSAKDGLPLQLFANGKGSQSLRTATSPRTLGNPVVSAAQVNLSVQSSNASIKTVKYFEQKVAVDSWNNIVTVTRDPLVALGEGLTLAKTFAAGTHMIVAFGYDVQGKLLAVDEITVKVQ